MYQQPEGQGPPGKSSQGVPVNGSGDERVRADSSPCFKAQVAASKAVLHFIRTEAQG